MQAFFFFHSSILPSMCWRVKLGQLDFFFQVGRCSPGVRNEKRLWIAEMEFNIGPLNQGFNVQTLKVSALSRLPELQSSLKSRWAKQTFTHQPVRVANRRSDAVRRERWKSLSGTSFVAVGQCWAFRGTLTGGSLMAGRAKRRRGSGWEITVASPNSNKTISVASPHIRHVTWTLFSGDAVTHRSVCFNDL